MSVYKFYANPLTAPELKKKQGALNIKAKNVYKHISKRCP